MSELEFPKVENALGVKLPRRYRELLREVHVEVLRPTPLWKSTEEIINGYRKVRRASKNWPDQFLPIGEMENDVLFIDQSIERSPVFVAYNGVPSVVEAVGKDIDDYVLTLLHDGIVFEPDSFPKKLLSKQFTEQAIGHRSATKEELSHLHPSISVEHANDNTAKEIRKVKEQIILYYVVVGIGVLQLVWPIINLGGWGVVLAILLICVGLLRIFNLRAWKWMLSRSRAATSGAVTEREQL